MVVSRSRGIIESLPGSRTPRLPSFTRLRPSLIPARRTRVRKCCLTVRGLTLNWPATSRLLQPCTSRLASVWSLGVHLSRNEIHHHNSSCKLSLLQIPRPCFGKSSPAIPMCKTSEYLHLQTMPDLSEEVQEARARFWRSQFGRGRRKAMAANTRTGHLFQFCWGRNAAQLSSSPACG